MKKISVVASCFNEEDNVNKLYRRLVAVFHRLARYEVEIILVDNGSTDATASRLRELAQHDQRVKVILNARNFGPIRSGTHAVFQAVGDAVVLMSSDLQDPPELIESFVEGWEEGYFKVMAVKQGTYENRIIAYLRNAYYRALNYISETPLIENCTGFGLYDRVIIEHLRAMKDPYPYFRGLVTEVGFDTKLVPFEQPCRQHGLSKSNFYMLYDHAMLGITNHSKIPLRIATIGGFVMSFFCFLVAVGYLIYKLVRWNDFAVGQGPLVIGLFLMFSVVLFFIGLLGEYVLAIHRHVLNRPKVIEKERINFCTDEAPVHGSEETTEEIAKFTNSKKSVIPAQAGIQQ